MLNHKIHWIKLSKWPSGFWPCIMVIPLSKKKAIGIFRVSGGYIVQFAIKTFKNYRATSILAFEKREKYNSKSLELTRTPEPETDLKRVLKLFLKKMK